MTGIADNIARIRRDMAGMGRAARLLAAAKGQPLPAIQAALDAGQRLFGENRVQEAQSRWADRKPLIPDLELHLIGPLQANKVAQAVALFDVIQTLDRPRLARRLAAEMQAQGRSLPCFIEVNIGQEPQKHGVLPAGLPSLLDLSRELGLKVTGLMCVPPHGAPPLPHFRRLAALAAAHGLAELSMGMSADWPEALSAGATCIRLGTAIFGPR